MIIEYRNKNEIIYDYLYEIKKYDNNEINILIKESLGAFEQQYNITREISSFAYHLMMNDKNEGEINLDNDVINKVHLTLELKTIWGVSASLNMIKEKCVFITLNMPKNYKMIDREKFINALNGPISYELMHYNVIVKRYENNVIPDDRPSYYDNIVKIITNQSFNDEITYDFAYALYSTFYQEVAAMVSQSLMQFRNSLKGNEINHKNSNIALRQCNSFNVYNNIINHTVPTISSMSDNEINEKIVSVFSNNGIECNVQWVRKQNKKIYNVAKDALHNIIRNVSLDLYK